jgi:hypothetical protein
MVAAIILFMGTVSGAHLNPAVSVAFAARGDFPWRRVPAYVVAQFLGAVLANVLGRLYGPGDGKNFDGVIGKDPGNPIPAWAEHGADRRVVPYTVATDMDSPNRDSGEEYCHANT